MNRNATKFLQGVVVLIGLIALFFLLREPHLEGRNANATVAQIYLQDPFLMYIYLASTAVFVCLYQAFRILGFMGRSEIFSPQAVAAVRTIKVSSLIFAGLIAGAELWIFTMQRAQGEDIAGGVMIGLFLMFGAAVAATAAAVIQGTLQRAVDLKSEIDLTV